MTLRVAGAQIPVARDIDANLAAIFRAIDFAAAEKAEVLLTPEASLSGYTHEFDARRVADALDQVVARAKGEKLARHVLCRAGRRAPLQPGPVLRRGRGLARVPQQDAALRDPR